MTKTSIKYIDYYIPENTMPVDDIIRLNKDNPALADKDMERYISDFKEQSCLDRICVYDKTDELYAIVEKMVQKMFNQTGIKPNEIKYLVCGNLALMEDEVSVVHYIHNKFNMNNAIIVPLILPCASTIFAMSLSHKLLSEQGKEYMLIISARKCPDLKGRYVGFTVMGDGISISLVENCEGKINIDGWNCSNNGLISFEKVKGKGAFENVRALQKHIISNGIKFINESIQQTNYDFDDVDAVIHANTNYDVWHKVYPSLLDIDPDKFYCSNIPHGGHLNDVDYVRNLKDYLEHTEIPEIGLNILVYGADLVQSFDLSYVFLFLRASR